MEQALLACEIRELEVMMEVEPFGDARLDRLFAFALCIAHGNKDASVADFQYPWPWPKAAHADQLVSPGGFTHPDLIAEFGGASS